MDLALGNCRDYAADDKIEHALAGYAIGATSAALVERLMPDAKPLTRFVVATVPAVIAGLAKEAYDARHADTHDSDIRDAIATSAGGALGALTIQITLHF